jgi:hypothetical protein
MGRRAGTLAPFVLAGALGAVAALWTWTLPGDPSRFPATGTGGVELHILNNGFHTDLAVRRADLEAGGGPLAQASHTLGPGDWVLIGWGDAKFFVDESPMEGRLLDGARAFFMPGNASVVMLDPEAGDPGRRFAPDRRRTVRLSPAGFDALRSRIETSLALEDGRPRLTTARPGAGARFFASGETFWIGYICNSWMARVLNAGGIPVRPLRAVTAGEVIASLDRAELDTEAPRD